MFGWFSSSNCPVDFAAKAWIEQQLHARVACQVGGTKKNLTT